VGSYLFIIGGHDGNSYSSDILFFNLGEPGQLAFSIPSVKPFASVSLAYETKPVAGQPPSARGYHVSILADSRIFIFGGFNGQDVYEDVHILDLAGSGYLAQVHAFDKLRCFLHLEPTLMHVVLQVTSFRIDLGPSEADQ